jgi:hypothetical protein
MTPDKINFTRTRLPASGGMAQHFEPHQPVPPFPKFEPYPSLPGFAQHARPITRELYLMLHIDSPIINVDRPT